MHVRRLAGYNNVPSMFNLVIECGHIKCSHTVPTPSRSLIMGNCAISADSTGKYARTKGTSVQLNAIYLALSYSTKLSDWSDAVRGTSKLAHLVSVTNNYGRTLSYHRTRYGHVSPVAHIPSILPLLPNQCATRWLFLPYFCLSRHLSISL